MLGALDPAVVGLEVASLGILKPAELWAAWSTCQAERERWLISDPLRYAEFELTGVPPTVSQAEPHAVEVESLTKPKQSGGVRLEVFLDVRSATFLQAVANRLGEGDLGLEHSLSAPLFGLRLKQENPYELWSASVLTWIRRELSFGRAVVMVDLVDYFGSVKPTQIELALRAAGLGGELLEHTRRMLEAISLAPDLSGQIRSGLPISPEELYWLVADLVLAPIDAAIEGAPSIRSHARWVDDFLLAVEPRHIDAGVQEMETVLEDHGFRLNRAKTRVFGSREEFDREFLTKDHEILSELFVAQATGRLTDLQKEAFADVVERQEGSGPQAARLVKRMYGLARVIDWPLLVPRARLDLERFPTTELQILSYLGQFGWPEGTEGVVLDSITSPRTDSRALSGLRAVLDSASPIGVDLRHKLRNLVHDGSQRAHPFAVALAFACLAGEARPDTLLTDGRALMKRAPDLRSATARRVAFELFCLVPQLRKTVRERIGQDPSPTVRGLDAFFQAERSAGRPLRLLNVLGARTPHRFQWGGLDARIATVLLPEELIGVPPSRPSALHMGPPPPERLQQG